jgi:hypothetical protein
MKVDVMNKTIWTSLILVMCLILMAVTVPVNAQESEYGISLRRDFGYGAGSNVRGTFTVSLAGEESLVSAVEFMIDGQVMAKVESAPFRYTFHTDDHGVGVHQLSARVFLHDGQVETTRSVSLNFVTPEEEGRSLVFIFGGIGGAFVLGLVIYWLVQVLVFKRKPGSTRQPGETRRYGLLGGTVCAKCRRAYSRHLWGLNLVVGRWDRCEHCGKWSMTVRATPEELRAAEAAEMSALQASEEDIPQLREIKDILEDTRYIDEV